MKKLILGSILFILLKELKAQSEPFTKRTVVSGLNSAWEVLYGPNDSLWVTENSAYKISRVCIANGTKTQLIDLSSNKSTFTTGTAPQGGLMGLVIHPNLYSSNPAVRAAKPWVYAAFVYNKTVANSTCTNGVGGPSTGCVFSTRIVRYDYSGNSLINPTIVLDNMPGSSDHNSGRLVIGPTIEPGADAAHTQYRLYYTIGDMGAGQFTNTNRTENAQNVDVMEGKVLRLNSESDGDAGQDAWIPNDNPFYDGAPITPKDYVYTLGHRNAQGLAWGNVAGNNILYSSEQMDRTDDEINIIESGKNYGWDQVAGYCDGNVNGYKIGQNTSANEQAFCSATPTNKEPIFTTFTTNAAGMPALMAQSNNALWPTIASSSIDFYGHPQIPGWNNSLLISPLKLDRVYRIKLNASGTAITGDTIPYFRNDGNRIRRVRVDPTGIKFYVARDVGATINGGAIMEYTYTGVILALNETGGARPEKVKDLIQIFPNPVREILYVHGKIDLRKPLLVQVCDIYGRLLKEETSFRNDFSVDVSSFRPGTYLLKLFNGNDMEVQIEKFIKE
jgi:PQQ-dependent dehydrogenase (s-GDH family)